MKAIFRLPAVVILSFCFTPLLCPRIVKVKAENLLRPQDGPITVEILKEASPGVWTSVSKLTIKKDTKYKLGSLKFDTELANDKPNKIKYTTQAGETKESDPILPANIKENQIITISQRSDKPIQLFPIEKPVKKRRIDVYAADAFDGAWTIKTADPEFNKLDNKIYGSITIKKVNKGKITTGFKKLQVPLDKVFVINLNHEYLVNKAAPNIILLQQYVFTVPAQNDDPVLVVFPITTAIPFIHGQIMSKTAAETLLGLNKSQEKAAL
jgi:hypothetical protein